LKTGIFSYIKCGRPLNVSLDCFCVVQW